MEFKVKQLRHELDALGYYQTFTPESTPLVEKLISDLKVTTSSLKKYMKIAQAAIEERDNLCLGAEPCKRDNSRLVKECNDLHLTLLKYKEQNDQAQRDLKHKLEVVQSDKADCHAENNQLKKRIRQLEGELIEREETLLKTRLKPGVKSTSALIKPKKASFEINSAMALADQRISSLSKDIRRLKDDNLQLAEDKEMLHDQISNRDKEISRLNSLLEGGRPLNALAKDSSCYCKGHVDQSNDQLKKIMQEKCSLECALKEALDRQHEAMKRALHLAERNKLLEREMKDIDHLALAVEAQCNHTVKHSSDKLTRLQDRVQNSSQKLEGLQQENQNLRREKAELTSKLEAVSSEKKHLQSVLETSLGEKKRLSDKINNFTIIENDLNKEIDRLTRLSAEQRQTIAELQASPAPPGETTKINRASKSASGNGKGKVPGKASQDSCPGCSEAFSCSKHLKELLDKELTYREQQASNTIDNLRSEKEYYMKEYHKVLEQIQKSAGMTPGSDRNLHSDLLQRLTEKEISLTSLQHENKTLSQEKYDLMARLESARERSDSNMERLCPKPTCKRTERERDLLRSDIERLDEETGALKLQMKRSLEAQKDEQQRLQKLLNETQDQVRRLEQEKRELLQGNSSRRAMEGRCEALKEELRTVQNELNHQRALYTQLKTLHEQSDLALSDSRARLAHTETELASALGHLKKVDHDQGTVSKEVEMLRSDIQIMNTQFGKMDTEKDELLQALDEKTEQMAQLQKEIKARDKTIAALETTVAELKRKIGLTIDESTNQELQLRNTHTELTNLRQELDTLKKLKDSAMLENRRLQDDLAAATSDCRDARKEVDLNRRQVEDLKTQLQQYVAEVKRTEDLISNKEIERTELLDQFRTLSHEANLLENNNHTLETEANQTRVQLSVALDHAADVERKLENKDSVIQSYERQISELTSQVAGLEMQLKQFMAQYDRTDLELQNMRDYCLKLDTENGSFKRQLREREDQRLMMDRDVQQLRTERETLEYTASNGRRQADDMEQLLDTAKQESSELKLINQDLHDEVRKLKVQVDELKDKFIHSSEQLDMYQEKALEYSQQNKQLRRDLANERFRRSSENTRYPSL